MSNFVVSARKYRPARFEDVVGQEHVSKTLKNALQSGQVAHAFLFCGPRGVGKTTCARILAKVLNCENRTPDFEACNECPSCKAFNENASFNITELDAASNNSVDSMRTLIDQVRFQPQQGRYKVFIIDEVHMLSAQAFNAFLKTLEEPPPYAIFILATTEKHKIIPTILSRCQIYDFRRIQIPDIVAHLQRICAREEIQADPDALHVIAQKADGALRDALSIFDRITSASGKNISYEDVIENLNVLDYDYYFRIVEALLTEDVSNTLLIFDDILKKGFDADLFVNGLAEHLRNLLVCKDEQTLSLLETGDALRERYRQQAAITPVPLLLTALNLANDCDVEYKMARNKRLHVEMALIKMAYINRVHDLSQKDISAVEKKSPDLSETATNSKSATPNAGPAIGSRSRDDQKETPPQTAAQTIPAVQSASDFATPNIISIDKLGEEVDAEELTASEKQQDVTMDFLVAVWQDYLAGNSSQMARTALSMSVLRLNGHQVVFSVPSSIAKGYLLQDLPSLREKILSEIHVPDLKLEVEIDASMAPANIATPKKPMTMKEKYEKMLEINPLLHDLRIRFDLKIDNES